MSRPQLYLRQGDELVPADPADERLAADYPDWPARGPVVDGRRISVGSVRSDYRVGEPVRIVHVAEILTPGHDLYVMGPKPVAGEWVDDTPAGPPAPGGDDPLAPTTVYDGRVLPSPGVDTNYEVTAYTFDTPGPHTVRWQLGNLVSNVLVLRIAPGDR